MDELDLNIPAGLDFTHDNFDLLKLHHLTTAESYLNETLAREILKNILQFRRTPEAHSKCDPTCFECQSPHLPKIRAAMKAGTPITLVLPAFPGKSPNLAKVLSPLPDMAERLALQFLDQLCERIQEIYAPGAKIILCSDGRVFSDIIGMAESDITNYQNELQKIIDELSLANLSTFNLDEWRAHNDFNLMRQELMESFGLSHESLKDKVRRGSKADSLPEEKDAHRMYCGITRFLVEDSSYPGQTKSRTTIQKECKIKAYDVIRRSNAWSELIAQRFPDAVRLSIHPQTCGSKKLGIRLIGAETWMTPWHGVAVKTNEGYTLLKRSEAEALGAQLIYSKSGQPSHYILNNNFKTKDHNQLEVHENEL